MGNSETAQVDQNLEGPAGDSAHDSLLRGLEPVVPTIPRSAYDPAGDWPNGPKNSEPPKIAEPESPPKRRTVTIMAQDEFGNDVPMNFVLETEKDDEDRFFVVEMGGE